LCRRYAARFIFATISFSGRRCAVRHRRLALIRGRFALDSLITIRPFPQTVYQNLSRARYGPIFFTSIPSEITMKSSRILLFIIALILFAGCSSTKTVRVAVPPKVDLKPYPVVGLVSFTCNGNADVQRLATERFLHDVQSAQPGTRVVELGSESEVLSSVGRQSWDAATLKAIKEKHGVDVVATGRLDMDKAKSKVQFSSASLWKAVSARSDVKVSLSAKLTETASGATMWTDSAWMTTNVANASFNDHGSGTFGASDPNAAYGPMIDQLSCEITDDFRTHYVTKRVPKDDVQTASAGD
jgi:hypothetical protein